MVGIIGAGFGRTGTLSLKTALEQLGFGPCHHGYDLMTQREAVPEWLSAAEGGPVDWDAVYGQYKATVDWPGARFWRELAEYYPDAPVILTVRDPGEWYESVSNTLHQTRLRIPAELPPEVAPLIRILDLVIWDGTFGGRFADRDHALRVFAEHDAAVRREIPADRLLVFDVAQGWEPLCSFLGIPVPADPFPRANESGGFEAEQRARLAAASLPTGFGPAH
ncbi:sulfotransferase family protein [Frankia sp. CNm7]|uniref:Sulfotransferase family protein n=1 Tax=Frankia nepalensis TaxID=1836974 RepID=A0A937RGC1_9ACTN|nr:sulfotransferase family protein [Frankia nepalensis]MBL7501840.1 sulfotransferase family protein [Frankia nepalensis]MBL7514096.1 sulfotransferase family protein [Frankia nepalensis]MBL7522866.1 sulfotransferase family protein [Frankia nepalensis]MBL7629562.1 sulfotransferase family protein [Frankia nepalensis]